MEALGLNLTALIAQIINFLIILIILRLALYKPILGMLDRRAARIRESLERAEAVQREAERGRAEFEAQIVEARRQGQDIVAQATQIGERLKDEARLDAERQAEQIITRAREEIARERDQAVAEIRREFADLTVRAASRVIGRELDRSRHLDLIDQVLAEGGKINRG